MKRLLVLLCERIVRLIGGSLRTTLVDCGEILQRPLHPPVIIAFWHNRTGIMPYLAERYSGGRKLVTFISASRDGQFMAEVAARFGIVPVRGSSSRRGAAAALAALRAAKDPLSDLVITPDGPRGPRYQVQDGILRLAQATGRPIVPITCDLSWKWELRSWDRFQIPLPFSACCLITADPIRVPPDATETELAALNGQIVAALGQN